MRALWWTQQREAIYTQSRRSSSAQHIFSPRIVERLLSAAANVNQADSFGRTALWVGVAGRCLKVVQLLVAQRADLNLGAEAIEEDFNEDDGITPLSLAAENGSLRILRFLIRSRANLNKADQEGRSPLWFAAAVGQPQCALALLKAGCNRDQMSRDTRTVKRLCIWLQDITMPLWCGAWWSMVQMWRCQTTWAGLPKTW
eukprot:g10962.t1